MLLRDIRDYVSSLGIAEDEHCYCGILPDKKNKSIGTYPLKAGRQAVVPVGGMENKSYKTKNVSFLVHWNKSPTETEKVAIEFYEKLQKTEQTEINGHFIKFIQMVQEEPVPVGTDDNGIFEYVIECLIYYKNQDKEELECQEK